MNWLDLKEFTKFLFKLRDQNKTINIIPHAHAPNDEIYIICSPETAQILSIEIKKEGNSKDE
jgi:hypothetical protein